MTAANASQSLRMTETTSGVRKPMRGPSVTAPLLTRRVERERLGEQDVVLEVDVRVQVRLERLSSW